ncbi:secreted protein [Streptomyces albus]|uniref:Secreted protein n=1 Tax=Streptomyces albus (strain ATCC 21838 / DSM 41398 / FERM P-419 / JCM 4703 / NBRC 107858) TaxID=1081613 RepID=A0A0B5F2U5_STRA4|nr:secreted protein [Streptomyces albus]AOU80198.1 secreted protein [Streptomyces albus]AYN35914.1 hypothetical protein DUI70_5419 [Streptomyces albus]
MNVRRTAAVLAAVAVTGAASAPAALAETPKPSPSVALPSGLYGKADPQFDGVWRQSLAFLAQDTASVRPADKAVDWLTGQQCADGSFAPFRADAAAACGKKTPVDSNSTAAAVQALAALGGHEKTTGKAVGWLKSVQNKDGGWGYNPGGASDTNSTSLVIGALKAAGEDPAGVRKGGKSPFDALDALTVPCTVKDGGGAFAFQPGKSAGGQQPGPLEPNADASAAGVLGSLGKGLAATGGGKDAGGACVEPGAATPKESAAGAADYVEKELTGGTHLMSVMPGAEKKPDFGNTADTVVALAAAGRPDAARKAYGWLEKNAADWARGGGPAAYAQLVLAAHAVGADPRAFGSTDLVGALDAQGPAPESQKDGSAEDAEQDKEKDEDGTSVWWIVGVGLVAGIGVGFLFSSRNKKQGK